MATIYVKTEDTLIENAAAGDKIIILTPYANSFHIKYFNVIKDFTNLTCENAYLQRKISLNDMKPALPFTFVENSDPNITEDIIPGTMWLNYTTGDIHIYKTTGWELFQTLQSNTSVVVDTSSDALPQSVNVTTDADKTIIIDMVDANKRIIQVYQKGETQTITTDLFDMDGSDFNKSSQFIDENGDLKIKNSFAYVTQDENFYKKINVDFNLFKTIYSITAG